MKIKEGYSLQYELDGIYIIKTEPDGTEKDVSPISETAAMAWEGIDQNISFDGIVDGIVDEFTGADPVCVRRDLTALIGQLRQLGYVED